jgi:hypothetical protein
MTRTTMTEGGHLRAIWLDREGGPRHQEGRAAPGRVGSRSQDLPRALQAAPARRRGRNDQDGSYRDADGNRREK